MGQLHKKREHRPFERWEVKIVVINKGLRIVLIDSSNGF